MPPKKEAPKKGQVAGAIVDEDLSEVMSMPQLHEFVFMNLYAFKYRKNLDFIEKELLKVFHFDSEKSIDAVALKTKKVIQLQDLLGQAKGKAYITE